MLRTVEAVKKRERYNLTNKVALKKDVTTTSYVSMRNCRTVWRERELQFNKISFIKHAQRIDKKIEIKNKDRLLYNRKRMSIILLYDSLSFL